MEKKSAFAKERHPNKYGVFCVILLRYRDAGGKLRTKLARTSHTPTYILLDIKEPSYSFQTRTVPRAVRGHVFDRRAHAGCPAPNQMRGNPAPHSSIDGDCAAVLVLGYDNGDDIMVFFGTASRLPAASSTKRKLKQVRHSSPGS